MGAQDQTEKVLRDIHVLFSKAQPVSGSSVNVVVNKNEVMDLLKELNSCMYAMMEEYEMTSISRDKADREQQKKTDEMVFDASRKAEDVYAASMMYTDEVLGEIQSIIKNAREDMDRILGDLDEKMKKEQDEVRQNQSSLKSSMSDMIDTQKYLKLIDEENHRRAKEKAEGSGEPEDKPRYADVVPEIHINEDYFRAQGLPVESDQAEAEISQSEEDLAKMAADLDAEYFDWKDGDKPEEEGKKGKGFSLFQRK